MPSLENWKWWVKDLHVYFSLEEITRTVATELYIINVYMMIVTNFNVHISVVVGVSLQ